MTIGYGEEKKVIPVIAGQNGEWKKSLIKLYPEEEAGIEKFFDMCDEVKNFEVLNGLLKLLPLWASWLISKLGLLKLFLNYWSGPYKGSTWDIVTGLTKNKDLQTVLTYCWGDYGSPPHESHFVMQVILYSIITSCNVKTNKTFSKLTIFPVKHLGIVSKSFCTHWRILSNRRCVRNCIQHDSYH